MPSQQNAVVITVDRVGTGMLGPYGNTWVETPAFNRFATESLLWEQMVSTGPTLEDTYRTLTRGVHPLSPERPRVLWEALRQAGLQTVLVSDEPRLQSLVFVESFSQRIECRGGELAEPAASPEETDLARVFLSAMEWLDAAKKPFLLWLHARGMGGRWDAPYDFRERFADEDDPDPPTFVDPPSRALGENFDPDEVLGYSHAYAAQMVLLDMCLEMLVDQLHESRLLEDTLLLVHSVRGFPLGEHAHVGPSGDSLHEELLHVPLLVRRPDQRHAMVRNQTLVQTADISQALLTWFGLPADATAIRPVNLLEPGGSLDRHYVVSALRNSRSIRTPAWFLRMENESTQLYAKPDDRWEVNEVAARCSDIVEGLTESIREFEKLAAEDRLAECPLLSPRLVERTD